MLAALHFLCGTSRPTQDARDAVSQRNPAPLKASAEIEHTLKLTHSTCAGAVLSRTKEDIREEEHSNKLQVNRFSRLSRSMDGGCSPEKALQGTISTGMERSMTEPKIPQRAPASYRSLTKRKSLSRLGQTSISSPPPRLSVTPSMELRQLAAARMREVAAMYAERGKASRERGEAMLQKAEKEKEKRRTHSHMTSLVASKIQQLQQERSSALRKLGTVGRFDRASEPPAASGGGDSRRSTGVGSSASSSPKPGWSMSGSGGKTSGCSGVRNQPNQFQKQSLPF